VKALAGCTRSLKNALRASLLLAVSIVPVAAAQPPEPGLESWVSTTTAGLAGLAKVSDDELTRTGTQIVLRLYLDNFEPLESWYGPGAPYGREPLASAIARGESRFHEALQAREPAEMRALVTALGSDLADIRTAATEAGVPLVPEEGAIPVSTDQGPIVRQQLRSPEMRDVSESLARARTEYAAGNLPGALKLVEQTYLQQFEPIEARLPGPVTREIESLIHFRLRPKIASGASGDDVTAAFDALDGAVARADVALSGETPFIFGAVNAFAIIVREGLEAVLLIAAILAYLAGIGAEKKEQRRIWVGTAAGVAASFLTWGLARTIVPVSGASRELMEGVTALTAVLVLLYVSNWLFQKTYIHDWKNYLRSRVGLAVTTGSALAMAALAFAAVYREGFETVLFYQALLFDTSGTAVLTGFVPGLLLIFGIGALIIRMGVKLPLRRLFAATNAVLLYLAFAFVGKGVYNLQEAGVFAPHPVAWIPDNEVLRQLFGLYPLVETLFAQLILLTVLLCTYVYYRRRLVTQAAVARREVREEVPVGAST
jgi:FTR1 family protein